MASTTQKVIDVILGRIDFPDPEVLASVKTFAAAVARLANSGNEFDDQNPGGLADDEAQGILDLADAFAAVANPDKNALVKSSFNKVYDADTPEKEAAGETLFADGLDFDLAANELNALLTARLSASV